VQACLFVVDVGFCMQHAMGFDEDNPLIALAYYPQDKVGEKVAFLKETDVISLVPSGKYWKPAGCYPLHGYALAIPLVLPMNVSGLFSSKQPPLWSNNVAASELPNPSGLQYRRVIRFLAVYKTEDSHLPFRNMWYDTPITVRQLWAPALWFRRSFL